jgi:hypothetical protein
MFKNQDSQSEGTGMQTKRIILYILLALGIVAIGAGAWFIVNPPGEVLKGTLPGLPVTKMLVPHEITVPQGSPVILMCSASRNASTKNYLYIYSGREVIAVFEGEARPDLGRQGFRFWKKSLLRSEQFDSLVLLFEDKQAQLNDKYRFAGYPNVDNTTMTGDMNTYLSIDYQGITKNVEAVDYLSPYSSYFSGTYAGMPSPLAEICQTLNDIALTSQTVLREILTP